VDGGESVRTIPTPTCATELGGGSEGDDHDHDHDDAVASTVLSQEESGAVGTGGSHHVMVEMVDEGEEVTGTGQETGGVEEESLLSTTANGSNALDTGAGEAMASAAEGDETPGMGVKPQPGTSGECCSCSKRLRGER